MYTYRYLVQKVSHNYNLTHLEESLAHLPPGENSPGLLKGSRYLEVQTKSLENTPR